MKISTMIFCVEYFAICLNSTIYGFRTSRNFSAHLILTYLYGRQMKIE